MPNKWKENSDGSTDFKEIKKWEINDMKETKERWAKEDAIKKEQEQKIVNLESKIEKKRMQKMFCSEKEKINLNLEINNMLKEIQNLKINFNLLEINAIDYQNQSSRGGNDKLSTSKSSQM